MSTRAQIIINLPSLRKMLMEDIAWINDNCHKQKRISIAGQGQCSGGRGWLESAALQFIYQLPMRARSRPEVKPHQAGDMYISEATVVVLSTRCSN